MSDQHLKIDKAGVLDVGAQLRANVDNDVTPHSDRITQAFVYHPVFGERSGSPVVQGAANQYVAQMGAAVDFLDALAYNVGVLARATQDVVVAYEHADTLSAEDFDTMLKGASTRLQSEMTAADAQQRAADAQEQRLERDQLAELRDSKRGAE